jgi:hypothetical protein
MFSFDRRRPLSLRAKSLVRGIAAWAVTMLVLGVQPAASGVTERDRGRACERTRALQVFFSDAAPAASITVQATGPSCRRARIIVTVKSPSERLLWREETELSLVESGEAARKDDPDIPFERVIGIVDNWVSVEPLKSAPAWPAGAIGPISPTVATDQTQYETRLDRSRYQRLRVGGGRMLCVPTGPETAHCLTFDPSTNKLIEFLVRGV